MLTSLALLRSAREYFLSLRNTMEEAAKAAAVSAAISVPGVFSSISYSVRGAFMFSGRTQHWWSKLGSPT
jgi:hypothetical protein